MRGIDPGRLCSAEHGIELLDAPRGGRSHGLTMIAVMGMLVRGRRGAELRAGLERIAAEDDRVGDIRGPGLMVGVEFVTDKATRAPDSALPDRLIALCADRGLLVLSCGSQHEVVRWIPPLDVTAGEISEAIEIFGEALAAA